MKNFYGFLVDRVGAVLLNSQLFSASQLATGVDGVPSIAADGSLLGVDGAVLGVSRLAALPAAPVDAVSAAAATNTLTSNNTNVDPGDVANVAGKAYTLVAALTPLEGEVLIGGSADASLTNLASAINHTGTPGTDYSCAAANPNASSSAVAAHALAFTALAVGAGGNALTLSTTAATLTPGGATFSGGVTAVAGTPGFQDQVGAFAGQPYFCTEAATVATAGAWKKFTLEDLS